MRPPPGAYPPRRRATRQAPRACPRPAAWPCSAREAALATTDLEPIDRPGLDTWLAWALLHEGRLARPALETLLREARRERPAGGATLARRLVELGAVDEATLTGLLRQASPAGQTAPVPAPVPGAPRRLGEYELLEELGRGGMGAVHLARHVRTGARYALKTLILSDAVDVARFQREGEAQARVDAHPHVVRVHELGRAGTTCYLVMDLCQGGSLAERLRAGLPPPEVAAGWVRALAGAVEHAHRRGVLHRDLKPANVLFQDGAPRLVDFGLARLLDARSLTETGTILGTPAWMAPEQVEPGRGPLGPATDVYGLGAILYCCLTGRAPCQATSAMQSLVKVLEEDPPPPSRLRPGVPAALEAVCLRALAKDPARRYPSAAALAQALDQALAARPAAGRSGRLLAAALGATALTAGLAVVWVQRRTCWPPAREPARRPDPPARATLEPATPATPATAAAAPTEPDPRWRRPATDQAKVWCRQARDVQDLDPIRAERLLRQVLERTSPGELHPRAAEMLGALLCYRGGKEVRDVGEGLTWVRRAVLMGDPEAAGDMFAVLVPEGSGASWRGKLPWGGLGVAPDAALAAACMALARAPGQPREVPGELLAQARDLLREQGVREPERDEAYQRVWRAWSADLPGDFTPSLPDLACFDDPTAEAARLLEEAREHERHGRYEQARPLLEQILASTPPSQAHAWAHERLSEALPARGEERAVLGHLQRGALRGGDQAALRLAAIYEGDAGAPVLQGIAPDRELARACWALALGYSRDQAPLERSRRYLGVEHEPLSPREAYRVLWRAFPEAR